MAAAAALDGVAPDSVEEARGKLYEAMARILTPDYDAGARRTAKRRSGPSRSPRSGAARRGARRGGVPARAARFVGRAAAAADAAAMASANPNDAVAQTIVLAEAALGRTAPLAAAAPKGSL